MWRAKLASPRKDARMLAAESDGAKIASGGAADSFVNGRRVFSLHPVKLDHEHTICSSRDVFLIEEN
jgi:hypothetical protein